MIDVNLIDSCFPKESFRQGQREIIEAIVNCINTGKKFIIAELPTGSGKSPIAVTLANLAASDNKDGLGRAYYITTTKILQDQIESDFGNSIATLKGRSNYPCVAYDIFRDKIVKNIGLAAYEQDVRTSPNCNEGYCKKRLESSLCRSCVPTPEQTNDNPLPEGILYSYCPYYEKYYNAVYSNVASMNFDNFILHLNYGKNFGKRKILIIDEAHNTEDKLLGFLETIISSKHLSNRIPQFEEPIEVVNWLRKINATQILQEKILESRENSNLKDVQLYEGILIRYINFMTDVGSNPNDWVIEYKSEENEDIIVAKPIFVKTAAKNLLFAHADIVVFLSATILNANIFANNLGIAKDEFAAFRVGSTFPVENRPIILDYAGKFTGGMAKQKEWIIPLTRKVEEIARRFPNERGIIHTHSFGIQKGIIENISHDVKKRLVEQHGYATKKEMLQRHADIPGSILIAPAMHEGIDLKNDLSRFQILCKVPYANYFENKQLAARMEIDRDYYEYITIMKIVQSVGRSVRSAEDWAYTYIIDEQFEKIYRGNNSFPAWFKEAVTRNLDSRINASS